MDHPMMSQDEDSEELENSTSDNQSPESLDSIHESTQSKSPNQKRPTFKKIPELEAIFVKEGYDENRNAKVKCSKCVSQIISNRYSRLASHIKDCPNLDEEDRDSIMMKYTQVNIGTSKDHSNDTRRNRKLAAMIIENNLSIHFVKSSTFKEFVLDLNSNYRYASRTDLSEFIIPSISTSVHEKFVHQIERTADYSLSIEFDLWTDLVKRSILGIVATDPDGSQYLIDLIDVSLDGTSSDVLVNVLKESLSCISACKINAMISDSGSNCKKARSTITQDGKFSHLIEHRCLAHLLNNIGSSMAEKEPYCDVIESATRIANLLTNDSAFLEKLRQSKTKRITTVTKTRWYSTVSMLESLINAREEALSHLENGSKRDKDRVREGIGNLKDSDFLLDLTRAVRYMRPLVNCIAIAERKDGSIGETIKAMLDYMSFIFKSDWNDEFVVEAASSFLSYFNIDKIGEFEFNIMLACYYLDRRYKMDFISKKGSEAVLGAVVMIADISGVSRISIDTVLYNEFMGYTKQRGILSKYAPPSQTARDWWGRHGCNKGILKIVGLRLANLKSTSANVERLFSMVRYIQGLSRTNFNLKTLVAIARSKLALYQNIYDNQILDLAREIQQCSLDLTEYRSARRRSVPVEVAAFASQTRTRLQSDILSNPDRDKLPVRLRRYYDEFTDLIDFSLVNHQVERLDTDASNRGELDLYGILSRFREDIEANQDSQEFDLD